MHFVLKTTQIHTLKKILRVFATLMLMSTLLIPLSLPLTIHAQQGQAPANGGDTADGGTTLPASSNASTPPSNASVAESLLSSCNLISWKGFSFSTCLAGIVYFFTVGITGYIAPVAGRFLDFTTAVSLSGDTYANTFIANAWTIARDLANMAFVFLLLYLAFTLILDIAGAGVGKQLAKIIAVALLINFSFFFSRVAIDASNILSHAFYDAIKSSESLTSPSLGGGQLQVTTLSANILAGVNIQKLFDDGGGFAGFTKNLKETGGFVNFMLLSTIFILMGIMNIILIFMFLVIGIQMLTRIVKLWFVIMLSPIGFIAWIIPGLGSIAKRWWDTLLQSALFAPAFMLGIYITIRLTVGNCGASTCTGGLLSGLNLAPQGGNTVDTILISVMFVILRLGIVIGMLFASAKIGDYFGHTSSKAIMSNVNKYGGSWATKSVGWATGQTVGRAANNLEKRAGNREWGNKYWTGGYALRKGLKSVAGKQFLGAESFTQRNERVAKRDKELSAGIQRVKDQQLIRDMGNETTYKAMSEEDKARGKQRIAALSKGELEGLGAKTIISIAQFLKPKQLETLEKSVEDGKLKKEELVTIKASYNGRIAIGRKGSPDASINEIDKATSKIGDLEAKIDPKVRAVPGADAIRHLFEPDVVIGDKELGAAQEALAKRLDYVDVEQAAAVRNGDTTRAIALRTEKRNVENQIEQVKKLKEKSKDLAVGAGNTFNADDKPRGGDTLTGQYRTPLKPTGPSTPSGAPTSTPPTSPTTPPTPPTSPTPGPTGTPTGGGSTPPTSPTTPSSPTPPPTGGGSTPPTTTPPPTTPSPVGGGASGGSGGGGATGARGGAGAGNGARASGGATIRSTTTPISMSIRGEGMVPPSSTSSIPSQSFTVPVSPITSATTLNSSAPERPERAPVSSIPTTPAETPRGEVINLADRRPATAPPVGVPQVTPPNPQNDNERGPNVINMRTRQPIPESTTPSTPNPQDIREPIQTPQPAQTPRTSTSSVRMPMTPAPLPETAVKAPTPAPANENTEERRTTPEVPVAPTARAAGGERSQSQSGAPVAPTRTTTQSTNATQNFSRFRDEQRTIEERRGASPQEVAQAQAPAPKAQKTIGDNLSVAQREVLRPSAPRPQPQVVTSTKEPVKSAPPKVEPQVPQPKKEAPKIAPAPEPKQTPAPQPAKRVINQEDLLPKRGSVFTDNDTSNVVAFPQTRPTPTRRQEETADFRTMSQRINRAAASNTVIPFRDTNTEPPTTSPNPIPPNTNEGGPQAA